jgi:penicillin amidase
MVFAPRALQAILHTDRSAWIDSGGNTMDDIVEKSLHQAVDRLESSLGDNTSGWTWGRQHTLTFEHVLGKRKPLNHIFNIGPYPVSGNQLTVNKKQYDYTNPYNTLVGASQRMIVDMSDPPASLHVLPTGQSGLLGSPHYRDQTALYLNGEYHQVWTDRRQLIDSGAEQLVLAPGNTRQ